jgi:hypothetical protein
MGAAAPGVVCGAIMVKAVSGTLFAIDAPFALCEKNNLGKLTDL